jgi:hypothetical protein
VGALGALATAATDAIAAGATDARAGGATGALAAGATDGLAGGATDALAGGATDGLPGGATGAIAGGATDGLAGGATDALGAGSSSTVATATLVRILQRCSTDAFTRYSITSCSMMTGRAMGWNAEGLGRIGTTVAADVAAGGDGGTGVSERGGVGFCARMVMPP